MIRHGIKSKVATVSTTIIGFVLITIWLSDYLSDHLSDVLLDVQIVRDYNSKGSSETLPTTNSKSLTLSLPEFQQHIVQVRQPVGVNLILPGASNFHNPGVLPAGRSVIDGDPMGRWGDIFQRVTSELATDTLEIANLDSQVRSKLPFTTINDN